MPCYSPLRAIRGQDGNVRIVKSSALFDFSVSCGRCIGCRLRYSQMWAIRCVHEAQLWPDNCAVTLTYSDEFLPARGSLEYADFQKFLKRLRKYVSAHNDGRKVRFFMGGEYGEEGGRPHFHALLFNWDFADKVVFQEREGKPHLWTSKALDKLWPWGFATIGEASFDSAAYIARYIVKKQYGANAQSHYTKLDVSTGELFEICPEFAHMSLKPGVGLDWMRLYWRDVFADLKVVSRGHKVPAPKYYLKYVSKLGDYDEKKLKAKLEMGKLWRDNTPRRLQDKARVASARLGLSRRSI